MVDRPTDQRTDGHGGLIGKFQLQKCTYVNYINRKLQLTTMALYLGGRPERSFQDLRPGQGWFHRYEGAQEGTNL